MSRERLARVALRAYPSATHADEMLATLMDASAGSRGRFVRELVDLVRLGLRGRATRTASVGAGRLVADGLCLAGIWLMTVDLTLLLSWRYRGLRDPLLTWPSIALLAAALAPGRSCGRRCDCRTCSTSTPESPAWRPRCCRRCASPLWCSRRGVDPRRLVWLAVPVALVIAVGPARDEQNPLLVATVKLAAIFGVAFALAMVPTDPRMAIAGAVGLSDLAVAVVAINQDTSVIAFLALTAAPPTVVLAVRRTRQLQIRR
jgi:hypothetical protein